MKIYTLTIHYNEDTDQLDKLEETIIEKEYPISINASPKVMEAFEEADLIGEVLVPYSGEKIGEA
tara:strand:- start:417 stop:611 length:195 start_codon:yes stop_codon:yes gene_type:complete